MRREGQDRQLGLHPLYAETEKEGVVRREVALQDKNDRVFGYLTYEMTKQVVLLEDEGSDDGGHKLLSLKLRGLEGKIIDVMELANPHKVDVLMKKNNVATYSDNFDEYGEAILTPFPDDQVNLAILLHELGHADQKRDKEMKYAGRMYSHPLPDKWYEVKPFFQALKEISFLSAAVEAIEDKIEELKNLRKELDSIANRKDSRRDDDVRVQEEAMRLEKREMELERRILIVEDSIKLHELMEIVHVACENDASARAMAWLKKIEEAGVNILSPQKVTQATVPWDDHEIDDPYTRLQNGVLSYCKFGNRTIVVHKRRNN